ncbi:hypothetical protein PIROE2DRAFT_1496 [Piromyces sp. E2]|nr:hypothetical protein PIROE2DRAFT_1496 [Piromyces sp. E2]|eukprot:OUM70358.1 hypothetical protein PIROE2DRAFT_1496 [Piromyces sp. E2]
MEINPTNRSTSAIIWRYDLILEEFIDDIVINYIISKFLKIFQLPLLNKAFTS